MSTISEKTKVNIYDVINSLPVVVSVVIAASFVYFQGNANSKEIETIKSDYKIILEKLSEIKVEIEKLKK